MVTDDLEGIGLDRDLFLRRLMHDLAATLEQSVGLEEASGFISIVGQRMGDWLDARYRAELGVDTLDRDAVARVLVDLKARIDGGFRIESISDTAIVLSNTRCPFGELVVGRPSLCMMTSNVFGVIAAENLGYARVTIDEAIARGDAGCRVRIALVSQPGHDRPVLATLSREYFATR